MHSRSWLSPFRMPSTKTSQIADLWPRWRAQLFSTVVDLTLFMQHRRSCFSNHFAGCVAQHSFGAGVEDGDNSVLVGGDNGNQRRGVQHRIEMGVGSEQFSSPLLHALP